MILEGFYNKIRNAIAAFHSQVTTHQMKAFGTLGSATTLQAGKGSLTGVALHNSTDVDFLVLVSNNSLLVVAPALYTVKMAPNSHYETPYNSKLTVTGVLAAGASSGEVAITSFFNNNNRS